MRRRLILIGLLAMAAAAPAANAVAGPLTFGQSALGGGGFQNVIAIDPAGSGLVLAGGDTSGIYRSTDWGASWQPSSSGLTDTSQFKVASIEFSPATPGRVYAAVGNAGSGGGLLVSDDAGQTWTLRSAVPQFAGGDTPGIAGLPPSHPRSTGHLLAIDPPAPSTPPPSRRACCARPTAAPAGRRWDWPGNTCARSRSTRPTPTW